MDVGYKLKWLNGLLAGRELVLPGGSVMALLLWLYRRQKKSSTEQLDGLPIG